MDDMRQTSPTVARRVFALSLMVPALATVTVAQRPGPTPVRFAQAREHRLQSAVTIPGTVRSPTTSLVASEVAGLVASLGAREGDRVAKGAPLAQLRQRPLELRLAVARAELKEAQARRELAEQSLERARDLRQEAVLSQQELDDASAEFTAWGGRVERVEAQIDELQEDLERSVIRAPFPGVVTEEHTEAGEWLSIGEPVVELTGLDRLEVVANVPERYFGGLEVGAAAEVRLQAQPGQAFDGTIKAIVPAADPDTRTFPVRISFDNSGGRVGVGMLAEVKLPVGSSVSMTIVPKDAVLREGGRAQVYVIGAEETVEARPVRTGEGVGDWIAILEGVRPGERVVTRGNERLRPGQQVAATPIEESAP
jgi:RND family efflux transporter MFP subunit